MIRGTLKRFDELGLSAKTLEAVKTMGYDSPTPVQEKAIPLVLEGRDIIAAAKTGTGKTGAFSLPSMDKLGHAKGGRGPLMLVITPTRELADQIGTVCGQIAQRTNHRITTVVGGLSYNPQIEKLRRGTDVLIATPGRLIDLMDQKAVNLSEVSLLVLDEADRMLDMGFLPAVRKIVAACPKQRQTLLFSATIDRSITNNMKSLLNDPAVVEIAHKGETADTVEQYIIRTPQTVKAALLKAVLEEKGSERVIVFARTRSRADSTCRRLKRAGYTIEAIHSDRSQNQRKRALERFANGEANIIVATDVLARGIDVSEVNYVINMDLPSQPEDYIHRIGRTGRAGRCGFAVSFVSPDTESALRDIQKLIKREIPEMELANFDFAAAEAEAVQKSQNAQARRDPELAQAKRELAKREQKKAKRRQENAEKNETKASAGRNGKRKGQGSAKPERPANGRKNQGRSKQQGSKQLSQSQAPKRAASGASDMRPGRAHRAAMQKRRGR